MRGQTDRLDLLLHSVAFAPKEALEGDFVSTTREAFRTAHDISAYSLVALSREAAPLMTNGGSILAMTYYGAEKVVPHYNVMGVAKASLEASTRYLAYDLGPKKIRVNCISAGPVNTLAARGISGFGAMLKHYQERAPLQAQLRSGGARRDRRFPGERRRGVDHRAGDLRRRRVSDHGDVSVAGRSCGSCSATMSLPMMQETLAAHGGDKWFANHLPEVVVFARTTEQVSALLRFASRAQDSGNGARRGIRLRRRMRADARRHRAVARAHEPHQGDQLRGCDRGGRAGRDHRRTAGGRAKKRKLFYPPDPASLKDCSMGGNVATNAGGPRCLKYGVTRNYVAGLEVVLANGEVLRTGARVHKNKTGFDLIGMFVGSEGMLGIVTEITVKLLPLPPSRATLSASFEKMSTAAATVQQIFWHGFLPSSLEIADHFTLEAARHDSGAIGVPPGNAHMLVDFDGQPTPCASRWRSCARLVEAQGADPRSRSRRPKRNANGCGRCGGSSAIRCAQPA